MIVLAFDLEKNSYDKTFSVQQDDQSMFIGTPSHLFSTHKLYAQEICLAGPFQMPNETSTLSQFIHVLLTDSFLCISETIFSKLNQFFLTKPFFIQHETNNHICHYLVQPKKSFIISFNKKYKEYIFPFQNLETGQGKWSNFMKLWQPRQGVKNFFLISYQQKGSNNVN